MIVKLLLLCIMRLTNGINIVSWSSHYDAACGDRCDADELLDGVLSYDHGWNAYNPAQGANQGTAWVIFDFELDVVLSQFDFIGSGDTTHDVADFKLYYGDSTDENGAWTELLSGRGAAGDSQWQTFTVDSNPGAQYYKWSIFNRHSNWQGYIYEVNFEYEEAHPDCAMFDIDGYLTKCSDEFEMISSTTNDLQTSIDNEASTRETKDNELQAAINDEATIRETKDNDEANTRETKDNELQAAMNAEATIRETKDDELTGLIEELRLNITEIIIRLNNFKPLKRANAMVADEKIVDVNTYGDGIYYSVWMYKDVIIVLLLLINIVVMVYNCVYNRLKNGEKNKYKKIRYIDSDGIDSEANLKS